MNILQFLVKVLPLKNINTPLNTFIPYLQPSKSTPVRSQLCDRCGFRTLHLWSPTTWLRFLVGRGECKSWREEAHAKNDQHANVKIDQTWPECEFGIWLCSAEPLGSVSGKARQCRIKIRNLMVTRNWRGNWTTKFLINNGNNRGGTLRFSGNIQLANCYSADLLVWMAPY